MDAYSSLEEMSADNGFAYRLACFVPDASYTHSLSSPTGLTEGLGHLHGGCRHRNLDIKLAHTLFETSLMWPRLALNF